MGSIFMTDARKFDPVLLILQNGIGWRICKRESCAAVGMVTANFNNGQSKRLPLNVAHYSRAKLNTKHKK